MSVTGKITFQWHPVYVSLMQVWESLREKYWHHKKQIQS